MDKTITVHLKIARTRGRFTKHEVEVPEGSYVIDAVERAFAREDPDLVWRHACHHASCGSCGLRVNGVEKLPCITPLSDYDLRKTLVIMPLAHLPRIADLVVDFTPFFEKMRAVGMPLIRSDEVRIAPDASDAATLQDEPAVNRWENCIECGLCVSACPAMSRKTFLGPAALAAAERVLREPRDGVFDDLRGVVESQDGIWQCRSAHECSAVCPMGVDPAGAIIRLRAALRALPEALP